jgi:hypothetical protein
MPFYIFLQKEGAPKRSPSAFFLFANARRPFIKEEHPGEDTALIIEINDCLCQ